MSWNLIINQKIFKYCIYYPIIFFQRMSVPFYFNKFQKSQYANIEDIQQIKLKGLIQYSKNTIPYYINSYKNISKYDIENVEDIIKLPFVTKKDIINHNEGLLSPVKYKHLTKKTTGGSTGEPVIIIKTADSMARELAATWRGYSWAGIDIGDRQGRFWGVPFTFKEKFKSKLIDFVANRKRCSAFSFDKENMKYYVKVLSSFKPKYFYGYVSMLVQFAEFIKNNNIKHSFNLKCIITTAEVLTDNYRNLLQEVFSTKVYNEYGCGELGTIAHECEYGSMHVSAENMIVEVFNENRKCQKGEIGELVITELNNKAMPLIRYKIGDFASISSEICKCGRTLPILENLYGRAYDIIKNRNGKLFHGEFFMYIFEEAKRRGLGIEGFQVVQVDYDSFKIYTIQGSNYSEDTEKYILDYVNKLFDSSAKIDFIKVNIIEREKSGKMRLIKSMVT